jgi:hypothetical protein
MNELEYLREELLRLRILKGLAADLPERWQAGP